MRKTFPLLLVIVMLFAAGCSSDPLSDAKLQDMFLKFMLNKGDGSKFIWEKLVELKNFKVLSRQQEGPDKAVVEISFDRTFRVNSADIEKLFPAEDLDKVFGPNKKNVLDELAKKDLKKGQKDATPHLQMILEKTDAGWTVKDVGLPKK